jgi:cytochrome c553
MSPETYRTLTTGAADANDNEQIAECTRCHGDADTPPVSRLVPRLAGQTEAYLLHALADYAHRRRPSGMMQLAAVPLEPKMIEDLAAYYASMQPAAPEKAAHDPARVERGRRIAVDGIREDVIPPCLACHSGRAAASFPRLSGQYAAYLAQQLRLFRDGLRAETAQGAIMTAIAERLDNDQIADVAAYFAAREPAEDGASAAPAPGAQR